MKKRIISVFFVLTVLAGILFAGIGGTNAEETYTNVRGVDIRLPALVAGRSKNIPLDSVSVKLYSDDAKQNELSESLYEIKSMFFASSNSTVNSQDTFVAGQTYDLTISIKAANGKPKLNDPVDPDGFYKHGVLNTTVIRTSAGSIALLSALVTSADNNLVIRAKIVPNSTVKLVSSFSAKYLGYPSFQSKPDYTMTLSTEGVESLTEMDGDVGVKNGIEWWYTSDDVSEFDYIDETTGTFYMSRNPMVRLYIKAKDGYVLDYPSVLEDNTIIYLGNSYISTSRTSLVKGFGSVSGYALDKAMYIDLEVPMEKVTVTAVNGYMFSGDVTNLIANGSKNIAGTFVGLMPDDIPADYYFGGWTSSLSTTITDKGTKAYPNKVSAKIIGNGNGTGSITFTSNFEPVIKQMDVYDSGWKLYDGSSAEMTSFKECEVRFILGISKEQYDRGYRLEITGYHEKYSWDNGDVVDYGLTSSFSQYSDINTIDWENGKVYLRDSTISGDNGTKGTSRVYYQLVNPDGTIAWSTYTDFKTSFGGSELSAKGLQLVLGGDTYSFSNYSGWQIGEVSAYVNHEIDFYWTMPTNVSVAGADAHVYAIAYPYVNDSATGLIKLSASEEKYDPSLGYYRVSTVTIPACNVGDKVRVTFQIRVDHDYPEGTYLPRTTSILTENNLYYTCADLNEKTSVFNSYKVGDADSVITVTKSYTASVTAPSFVNVPVTITTKKFDLTDGYTLSVLGYLNGSATAIKAVDNSVSKTTSYSFGILNGVPGESATVKLTVRVIQNSTSKIIELGSAVLNITFAEYDDCWKGKIVTDMLANGKELYDFFYALDIYKDYTMNWYWNQPENISDRFVLEPRLELYREYDWEQGNYTYTYVEWDALNTVLTNGTYKTSEAVSGNIDDMTFCKKTTMDIMLRDTKTGKRYLIDSRTATYSFVYTFSKAVRVNGTDVGYGNSIDDQTVSSGKFTLELDWIIPSGLSDDGYLVCVNYYIYDKSNNELLKSGSYIPSSIKFDSVSTFELTLDAIEGKEYEVELNLHLVEKNTLSVMEWGLESNQLDVIVSDAALGVKGDVNGDGEVDSSDATMILKYDAGMLDFTDSQTAAGDVNGDGETDSSDATMVLKYDAGMIDSL